MKLRACTIAFLVLGSCPRYASLAQELLLTEFMADNSKTLADEDREFEDWVEVFNAGDADLSLEGYFLSDDAANPTLWRFPAVVLGAKRFLVVFCSGKDRRDPALALHTSFKLDSDGGDVLLVAPDGKTVLTQYHDYPEQQADTSHGMATDSKFASPVVTGAAARVLVPPAGDLGLRWTELDFDDGTWRQGTTAVGYGGQAPELDLLGTNVAAEMQNLNASVYVRIPFEVADPAALDVLKLRMRYDDGFAAFVNGQLAVASNAPAAVEWNSVATRSHAARTWEEFDISSQIQALRPGRNVLAIQGLNATANNNDLFMLPELSAVDIGQTQPAVRWFFPAPTPGDANGPGFLEAAPRPAFSLTSGTYVDARQVALTTDLPEAVIRYTLDGTVPVETSTLYAAPLDVTGPARITARLFKAGMAPGIPERNTYIILHPNVAAFSSNLPIVICTTFGKPIGANCGGGLYTPGYMTIVTPGQDGRAVLADASEFSSGAAFRRRGSSTCGNAKFAFNVEVTDAEGRDKNADIFDFPRESDYIMYAPNNFDRALMRNPVAYWMSRECGRWAARTRFVECYYHPGQGPVTASSYFGVYSFTEKNKQHPEKVDISQIDSRDNEEPDVTGGYILRRDRVGQDEIAISAGGYSSLVFVYPKVPTAKQRTYMTQAMTQVIGSLNPNIGRQEDNPLIDFTGWIDHHILNWYPKNVDAFRLSGYFYKDRNGPVVMGPVWDYDRTMGCSDDDRARDPEGWDNLLSSGDGGTRYFEAGGLGSWYSLLFRNRPPIDNTPWNVAYRARWRELRLGPLRTDHILGQIDAWSAELQEAAVRDTQKWPGLRPRFGSFQGEVDHLKDWLSRRADWIDTQFIEAPRFNPPGGNVERGLQVEILLDSQASIYYTLDGSDPRGAGAQPSPAAVLYAGPITINANAKVSARALYPDGLWSSVSLALYVVDLPPLMITEIMYKPSPPTLEEDPAGQFNISMMEFLEVTNTGAGPVPLAGVTFAKGVTFTFDGVAVPTLEPGQSVVIPRNRQAFAARYGARGILIAGEFGGTLTDSGEAISLAGRLGEVVFDFRYAGSWYAEASGGGYSLVNRDPRAPTDTLGDAARWRPSDAVNGSPGRAEGLSSGGKLLPGDSNRDGKLQVTDSVRMLLLLVGGLRDGPCGDGGLETAGNQKVLDWDGNSEVNLTDALSSLRYLFQAGPPHTAGTACVVVEGCAEGCGG